MKSVPRSHPRANQMPSTEGGHAAPIPRPGTPVAVILALALASALGARTRAEDCKLSPFPEALVVRQGEQVGVNVFAQFSATTHAFASAGFDVLSTHPAWTHATAGAVVGNDVLGIVAGQDHLPHLGDPADPSNPIRVWHGRFSPASADPAFVEFKVAPGSFEVYPSALTGSSAPCDASGGEAWIFANPVYFGVTAGAPGEGTTLGTAPDGFVADGSEGQVRIGLLLPAVQKVREAAFRLRFENAPRLLTTSAHAEVPTEQFSLNFEKVEFSYVRRPDGRYDVLAALPPGYELEVRLSRKGRLVATIPGRPGESLFVVDRVPDVFGTDARLPRGAGRRAGRSGSASGFSAFGSFNGGVRVAVGDVDGDGMVDRADFNLVRGHEGGPAAKHANNLKQIALACHTYQAVDAGRTVVTPLER